VTIRPAATADQADVMMERTAPIGIVGLGLLGHAVASRLLASGRSVVGYDVVKEKVDALESLRGHGVASLDEVVGASDAILILLPSLASVEETILGTKGILTQGRAGQTIIQMSTISPTLTRRLAQETSAKGLMFLDGPVSGTSAMVARGEGMIMVGGERAAFERWRPTLESILRTVYVGDAGQAMVVKLIANLLVGLNSAAAAEALAMARKAGLDERLVLEILTGGAGTSRMLELRGPMMVEAKFPPQMKLELFLKDLGLILEAGKECGASLPLATVAERLYAKAYEAGHPGEDLAVVVRVLERDFS